MSNIVMIMGESGSGKSRSLLNMDPKASFLIQSIRKPLPFRKWRETWSEVTKENANGNVIVSDDATLINKYMVGISERKPQIKTIVIDDSQFIMSNDFMRSALETGYGKFTRIGQAFWQIVNQAAKLRDDLTVVFLHHTEINEQGKTKAKTIGKMLDSVITIEGLFTIVLLSDIRDGKHVFVTKNEGRDSVKAPEGMFSGDYIENDLNQVVDAINAY